MLRDRYLQLSDDELIALYQEGESMAMDVLLERYKPMVRRKARSMFILGGDQEDLIQEGMVGLFKAVRDYDQGRDAGFETFARLCVSRQLYSAVQASARKKHQPLNSALSLNQSTAGEHEEGGTDAVLMNLLSAAPQSNPELQLIDRENLQDLQEWISTQLSSFEQQVLELYLTGMNYVEIAKVLNKSSKSTDNALQRIRQKLRRYREKEESGS